jgi:hypothetical protein
VASPLCLLSLIDGGSSSPSPTRGQGGDAEAQRWLILLFSAKFSARHQSFFAEFLDFQRAEAVRTAGIFR